ncbi:response regulator transcription factor [Halobacillus litoralis]|uniref:Response regulatory domain-containing protein n=1 Tax=Halobacillus litoralis TaxID=45668 RepID=A0A410MJI2_9BACI|nr:response regulator transcription factor [Halobacillus litoralis]QAS54863.1 hypothetical protein HLI_20945 [Halobacillus litoralis]
MKRILILDGHLNYREGFKNLLEVAVVNCKIDALKEFPEPLFLVNKLPNLIIVDPTHYTEEELANLDCFIEYGCKVVFLFMNTDEISLLNYLRKNVQGFLLKSMKTHDLVSRINKILVGERYIHPSIGEVLWDLYQKKEVECTAL